MQQRMCSELPSTSVPLLSMKPPPNEEDFSVSAPSIRSSAIYADSEEDPYDECFGDSNDFIKASVPYTEPEESVSRSLSSTKKARGMDFSDTDAQDVSSNLVVDSLDSEWTDDKHSSYLDSMEALFVKQMYTEGYCASSLHGQAPQQQDSFDPDCAESKPNFPSVNEFKVWENRGWQHSNLNNSQFLEAPGVAIPAVMASPWMRHFVPATFSRGQAVTARTVHKSSSNCGISTVGGKLKSVVESNHSGYMRTLSETVPDEEHRLSVWHHRLQSNFRGSTGVCGKRELVNIYARKSHVSTTQVTGKQIQDSEDKAKVEGTNCNRVVKKQNISTNGICHSTRDQVVPLFGVASTEKAENSNSRLR